MEYPKYRSEIPDFLNEKDLRGIGVEVGVQRGDFSRTILNRWQGTRLYMVDIWAPTPGTKDVASTNPWGQLENMSEAFKNVFEFGYRAVMLRDSSVAAAELFGSRTLDFVYLDAAHDYKSVVSDIEAWVPKIKRGGFLMGHDYADNEITMVDPVHKFPVGSFKIEVKRAVDEWAEKYKHLIHVVGKDYMWSWMIRIDL
jgi:hypothetical protein